ncbi:hypothetical protein [Chryseobacterium sp. 7]|uniref:hypothetical protein n=1 Tax=Chryseobacterium sp. 7 TaxID=2035214 RepID=UPI0016029D92|nr:hypothetical protein [Chryseobacterium sp. 7]
MVEQTEKIKRSRDKKCIQAPGWSLAGTKIGTDIIILKKNVSKQSQDISGYFSQKYE